VVEEDDLAQALHSNFNDFEDALQYYTALRCGMEYILTRNIRDYRHAHLKVMTAAEFIKIHS
jgi:hypothetical protein